MRLDLNRPLKLIDLGIKGSTKLLHRLRDLEMTEFAKTNRSGVIASGVFMISAMVLWSSLREETPPALSPSNVAPNVAIRNSNPNLSLQPTSAQPTAETLAETLADHQASKSAREGQAGPPTSSPITAKHKKHSRKRSIEDELGLDIVKAADDTLADERHMRLGISPSLLKSIGISKKQYLTIKMREQRLTERLKAAEERGSTGRKRILVNDHKDWVREYLGPGRYERFQELEGSST